MATDSHTFSDTDLFGAFRAEEVEARGRLRSVISDAHVQAAYSRVQKSGVLEMLTEWHSIDHPLSGMGGQPAKIHPPALLVGLLLLAQEHSPLFMRNLAALFQERLTPASRDLLGLPSVMSSFVTRTTETTKWEKNTNNAFHRMVDLMDPYPMKRYVSLTYTQVQQALKHHDDEREQTMKRRLDLFMNAFLRMTFKEQPRRIQRATNKLDISFDQTFIEPPTKKGFSRNTLADRARDEIAGRVDNPTPGPVDIHAGWYPRKGNRVDVAKGKTDTTGPGDAKNSKEDLEWGWMINIAVRVDSERPDAVRFPKLAVAATMSMPNVGVSEEAVELMRAALGTELPPGLGDADKQYWANARPERLHLPADALGWTASTDYRPDRLGVRGSKKGVEFIEDGRFCPGTPTPLKNATKDLLAGRIDEDIFQERRHQRGAFLVRSKEKPDAEGRQPVSCPARGNSPTVTCPVFELLMGKAGKPLPTVADKERPRVEEEDAPPIDFLPEICRQHSVSLNVQDGIQGKQGFAYRSKEWDAFHKHARNSIESLNAGIKDPGKEAIGESSRRRVRGFAAAQVFVTMLLTNFNLRKIAAFLHDERAAEAKTNTGEPPKQKSVRRRDRVWYNPYTKTTPRESVLELQLMEQLSSPLRT
ncbi:hypothetical protein [Diaminobutyricimonas sp. LJ205]|uniref:hypothetical protein n=1 Tax=Diaminobutyricimonas sp. LJ205 TaxID=2683590 RepID=UPI0012F4D76D|nr:hypothetical protein [Diaminobutyricimonas sp. LJ205]